jgi:ubiquinol-cytochrome c reductase iron-sulfur subunit
VFSGVPAPFNLPVPPYHFVNNTTIRIGENPQDSAWNFDAIRQL